VGKGLAVAVDVAVAVGVGVGVGVALRQKISIVARVVKPLESYPPESQMRLVPSVSVGKLRRGVTNGWPTDQLFATGS
jgi:hypothetical protein